MPVLSIMLFGMIITNAEPLRDCTWYEIINYDDHGTGIIHHNGESCVIPPKSSSTSNALPNWVNSQFVWYVDGDIDEETLLTSMNWMFDNNIMHLSPEAAQEVQDMRNKINDLEKELEETQAAIAIPNLIEARKGANESAAIATLRGSDEPENIVSDFDIIDDAIGGYSTKLHLLTGKDSSLSDEDKNRLFETAIEIDTRLHLLIESLVTENPESFDQDSQSRVKVKFPWIQNDSDFKSEVSIVQSISEADAIIGDALRVAKIDSFSWEQKFTKIAALHGIDTTDSVIDDLQGIVVLCSIPIEKELEVITVELEYIEVWVNVFAQKSTDRLSDSSTDSSSGETAENTTELNFLEGKLTEIESKITSIQIGLDVLEGHTEDSGLKNKLDELQSTSSTLKTRYVELVVVLDPGAGIVKSG